MDVLLPRGSPSAALVSSLRAELDIERYSGVGTFAEVIFRASHSYFEYLLSCSLYGLLVEEA
jgi:hypothetical protein